MKMKTNAAPAEMQQSAFKIRACESPSERGLVTCYNVRRHEQLWKVETDVRDVS